MENEDYKTKLEAMLDLKEVLVSILDYDKKQEIVNEFIAVLSEMDINHREVCQFLNDPLTNTFGSVILRELSLLRFAMDLPYEYKTQMEEHLTKISFLQVLTSKIDTYFDRYANLNVEAKEDDIVFSKWKVLKAYGVEFDQFNTNYERISKTSFLEPILTEYLEIPGAKTFFKAVEVLVKYCLDLQTNFYLDDAFLKSLSEFIKEKMLDKED